MQIARAAEFEPGDLHDFAWKMATFAQPKKAIAIVTEAVEVSFQNRHFTCFFKIMFSRKCPHCGVKLGDFLYADVCPYCQAVLKHNLATATPVQAKIARVRSFPERIFFRLVRFVES